MQNHRDSEDDIENDFSVSEGSSTTTLISGLLSSLFCSCFASPHHDFMSSKQNYESNRTLEENERDEFESKELNDLEDTYTGGGTGGEDIDSDDEKIENLGNLNRRNVNLVVCEEFGAADFEKYWQEYTDTCTTMYDVHEFPESLLGEEFEVELTKKKIFTLASGRVNQTLKLYVYAKETYNGKEYYFLMDIRLDIDEKQMQVKLKGKRSDMLGGYLRFFESILRSFVK
mmetsp:Transcript_10426/g.15243  ORF Transcript_10426/g.15243 Transcript_10426/m.15243 type:complete len:229 (-) Transcript_10426:30-716(-)